MLVYIGDLDKKEVLNRIYNNFLDNYIERFSYLNINKDLYKLNDKYLNRLVKHGYIGYLNGIYINMTFLDDNLEFEDGYSQIYLDTIFDMKCEKSIIYETPLNAQVFSDLRTLKRDIEVLREKIKKNNSTLSALSFNNEYFKNSQKSIIKNNYYDITLLECRRIWKETKLLESDLVDKLLRRRKILEDLVNLKTYSIGR
mgnify:CR=1 FL=1